jgi:photosystem II oxygen-evolving enhancer protein 3
VVLGGLLAGVAALSIPASALAIDLVDDRKAKNSGFDIIYEARDLDLPQATRDGFTQARTNLADTQKRIKESERRIDEALEPLVKKQYWTLAREELRGQVGTLRFDLGTLVDSKGKPDKKKGNALKKAFLLKAEQLDYALREKNQDNALSALSATKSGLDEVVGFLL